MGNEGSKEQAPIDKKPLGYYLPAEIVNVIYELVLEEDKTAVIFPRPGLGASDKRSWDGKYQEEGDIIFASTHALMQTCKASRAIYYPMFKAKALGTDLDDLTAIVEDFNFHYFVVALSDRLLWFSPVGEKLASMPIKIRLTFTDEFFLAPNSQGLDSWLERYRDDDRRARPRSNAFEWIIDPISAKYVEDFVGFLNIVVGARGGIPGPELCHLMHAFREAVMRARG